MLGPVDLCLSDLWPYRRQKSNLGQEIFQRLPSKKEKRKEGKKGVKERGEREESMRKGRIFLFWKENTSRLHVFLRGSVGGPPEILPEWKFQPSWKSPHLPPGCCGKAAGRAGAWISLQHLTSHPQFPGSPSLGFTPAPRKGLNASESVCMEKVEVLG